MKKALKALSAALHHVSDDAIMQTSAALSYIDAKDLFEQGDYLHAYSRAMMSLKYSIGVFHSDYQDNL